MIDSCRTTSFSVMLSMGPRGVSYTIPSVKLKIIILIIVNVQGYGARGHRFRRHSHFMSVSC